MEKVKQQELIWNGDEFLRRTILESGKVIWEKPSQYGTFTKAHSRLSELYENKYKEICTP